MRKVVISNSVRDKLEDLEHFLVDELQLSEEAAKRRSQRMRIFIQSFSHAADYRLCRFKRWRALGYHCAVFEKRWVFAYEIFDEGVIVRDMSHTAHLTE